MLNDIKLDGLTLSATTLKAKETNVSETITSTTNDGISVSSHLNDMAKTLLADDDSATHRLKIEEITRQVNQKSYRVNLDGLVDSLAKGILLAK